MAPRLLLVKHRIGLAMEITEITEFNEDVVTMLHRLMPQLSASAAPPYEKIVQQIVSSDASRLLVAKEDGIILGMLTIVIFPIPSGVRAWIEDVVVDEAGRGKGVGEALSRRALDLAKSEGAITVDLTSRPSREAANRLYMRIGFVPRETNIYRFDLK